MNRTRGHPDLHTELHGPAVDQHGPTPLVLVGGGWTDAHLIDILVERGVSDDETAAFTNWIAAGRDAVVDDPAHNPPTR